jgi:hypothetical protein
MTRCEGDQPAVVRHVVMKVMYISWRVDMLNCQMFVPSVILMELTFEDRVFCGDISPVEMLPK